MVYSPPKQKRVNPKSYEEMTAFLPAELRERYRTQLESGWYNYPEAQYSGNPQTNEEASWVLDYLAQTGNKPTPQEAGDWRIRNQATPQTFFTGGTQFESGFRGTEDYANAQRYGLKYGPYSGTDVPGGGKVTTNWQTGKPFTREYPQGQTKQPQWKPTRPEQSYMTGMPDFGTALKQAAPEETYPFMARDYVDAVSNNDKQILGVLKQYLQKYVDYQPTKEMPYDLSEYNADEREAIQNDINTQSESQKQALIDQIMGLSEMLSPLWKGQNLFKQYPADQWVVERDANGNPKREQVQDEQGNTVNRPVYKLAHSAGEPVVDVNGNVDFLTPEEIQSVYDDALKMVDVAVKQQGTGFATALPFEQQVLATPPGANIKKWYELTKNQKFQEWQAVGAPEQKAKQEFYQLLTMAPISNQSKQWLDDQFPQLYGMWQSVGAGQSFANWLIKYLGS